METVILRFESGGATARTCIQRDLLSDKIEGKAGVAREPHRLTLDIAPSVMAHLLSHWFLHCRLDRNCTRP